MPCTPTGGLSHSYISRWADLTMLHQPSSVDTALVDGLPCPSPCPSPARGRGRSRRTRKDENETETDRTRRVRRTRQSRASSHAIRAHEFSPTDDPQPFRTRPSASDDSPTNSPRRSSPALPRTPVLLDGLGTRRPSRLSAELDLPTPLPETRSWEHPSPPPPYSTSHATTSAAFADESSASVIDDLVADSIIPMRLHRKSDPVPACLSSVTSASIDTTPARPIPIPKPSPRVPSDYGGVSSVSQRPDESALAVVEEPADVTAEWCDTTDVVPVPITITHQPKKKRFFIGLAPGESYDGDMDSESSWR
ncbi:hypothetical protein RHS01_05534 [Rhizoctonia solani]|uniref:Uncharacterized protein n=1 Tax=Rhizoctonia solani TaxID=456999 RepID=A0A8H7M4S8_9AGAM|nr:hypothetical protein RHS01_05534 [Rhizoctonia solani]